ncbi:metal-sensitive transcriptional regulator [Streptomyces sp. NBC_01320]|nr:metal-sensing transcriptional repressor [Streptomyces sp. NBC_01320]
MVDDRYCIDILTQICTVNRSLQEVVLGLLHNRVRHCVTDTARADKAQREAKLDELASL